MSSINTTNYNIDQTVRVFDSFYEYDVNVPAAEYDIVYSYFRKEMTTAAAAGNFTVSLFQVADRHCGAAEPTQQLAGYARRFGFGEPAFDLVDSLG